MRKQKSKRKLVIKIQKVPANGKNFRWLELIVSQRDYDIFKYDSFRHDAIWEVLNKKTDYLKDYYDLSVYQINRIRKEVNEVMKKWKTKNIVFDVY